MSSFDNNTVAGELCQAHRGVANNCVDFSKAPAIIDVR